jgi:hypothetical protein
MCTVLLPPGGYPIAVKYIVSYYVIWTYNTGMHEKYAQRVAEKMLTYKQQLYDGVRRLELAQSKVYGRAFPKSGKYF